MPGRLTAWKGHEVFIEALNLVNQELGHPFFYAVILGSDQGRDIYTKKIKRLAEQYRLMPQLKFVEHCKNMPLAYKVSNLVVSASIEPEAFGRVAIEAQSMEKPIIASDIGGSNETITNNVSGFLFESNNPESLSKKIIEVLNLDESRLKLIGIEGRKNIIKKFNVEKMCFSTYSEYKKLLN
jgi:glycosyltransferase involved in cell wall biosynthesis